VRNYKAVKCNIRELIMFRGMLQVDFARKIGVSKSYITDVCNMRTVLGIENAYTFAKALEVNVEDLYVWKEDLD
jgi:transcriptional regulator with XRE-family HTH domain